MRNITLFSGQGKVLPIHAHFFYFNKSIPIGSTRQ